MTHPTDEQLARAANSLAQQLDVEHPFVETDLSAYVGGELSHADQVRIEAHLEQCPICREDVDDLRAMKRVIDTPKQRSRWVAYSLAAGVAALALTAVLMRDDRPAPNTPQPTTNVVTTTTAAIVPTVTDTAPPITASVTDPARELPNEWKTALDRAVRRGALQMPATLAELQIAPDPERGPSEAKLDILQPAGMIVETTRPSFEWTAVDGATYVVTIVENLEPVMESPELSVTRWRPQRHLERGHVYQWQVSVRAAAVTTIIPSPPAPPAMFRVLDAAAHAELERARADHPDDPLLLGVLYAERGLRAEAIRELRKVKTDVGRKLLQSVEGWTPSSAKS